MFSAELGPALVNAELFGSALPRGSTAMSVFLAWILQTIITRFQPPGVRFGQVSTASQEAHAKARDMTHILFCLLVIKVLMVWPFVLQTIGLCRRSSAPVQPSLITVIAPQSFHLLPFFLHDTHSVENILQILSGCIFPDEQYELCCFLLMLSPVIKLQLLSVRWSREVTDSLQHTVSKCFLYTGIWLITWDSVPHYKIRFYNKC